jgi:hypothetical protein
MGDAETLQPTGDKMKRAIRWLSETVQNCPTKSRRQIIEEAQVRFDLSPAECAFLEKNFDTRPVGN